MIFFSIVSFKTEAKEM